MSETQTPESVAAAPVAAVQPTADPAQISTVAAELTNPETEKAEGQAAETHTEAKTEPVDYGDFTVPEGVTLDPELTTEFKGIAQEMNLTKEQAQQVADLGVKLSQKIVETQQAQFEAQKTQWAEAARADKEFGGQAFEANLAVAKKAVDAFVSPELKQLLDTTGLGNHPDMVRAFYKIGRQLSDDALVPGTTKPTQPAKTLADILYPS